MAVQVNDIVAVLCKLLDFSVLYSLVVTISFYILIVLA